MVKQIKILMALIFIVGCADFKNSPSTGSNAGTAKPDSNVSESGGSGMDPQFDPKEGSFSDLKMVANVGLNIIQPLTQDFRLQTEILGSEIQRLCSQLEETQSEDPNLELGVQKQWKNAMLAYHRLAAVPVGPLSENQGEMATNIYAWPYISPCGIDIQVEKNSRTGKVDEKRINSVRGLGALEYLLFEPELKTQCNPNSSALKPVQDWVKKSNIEKKTNRCQYAQIVNAELIGYGKLLEKKWSRSQDNYTQKMINQTLYPKISDAVNALTDSLFALEKLKDNQLGKPLGFHKECLEPSGKCPQLADHNWSQLTLEGIEAQLQTLQRVFYGGGRKDTKAFGLDDALAQIGRSDVEANVSGLLDSALRSVAAAKDLGSFQKQLSEMDVAACKRSTTTNREVEVCSLFQELKELNIKMKTELLVALALKAPPVHQGDSD